MIRLFSPKELSFRHRVLLDFHASAVRLPYVCVLILPGFEIFKFIFRQRQPIRNDFLLNPKQCPPQEAVSEVMNSKT